MEQAKQEVIKFKNGRPTLTESGLRPKHRAFIRNLMSGQGIGEAGREAGFGRKTGYDLMKNPAVRSELAKQLETAGVTDSYLAKKVKQGLNAKTVPHKENGKRYDDQFVRKQWADIAIKIKGGYAPEKLETEHKIINVVIDSNMLKALKDSKALSDKEVKYLERLPMEPEEVIDAEITETNDNAGYVGCPSKEEGGRDIEEIREENGDNLGEGEGRAKEGVGPGPDAQTRGIETREESREAEGSN